MVNFEKIKHLFIETLKDKPEFDKLDKDTQKAITERELRRIIDSSKTFLTKHEFDETLNKLLENVVYGLRKLQVLQDNPTIEDIMINGLEGVYIKERFSSNIKKTDIQISSTQELRGIIERLMQDTGRRLDKSTPLVDFRSKDGTRVNIVSDPISLKGSIVTIRKPSNQTISIKDLIEYGTLNHKSATILEALIKLKKNIVVAGGTGSGKTTTLTAMTSKINKEERLVVIEDTSEIRIPSNIDNVVYLETRPENAEGKGEITIRALVKNALRMRPDRIIIGECRGAEAFDMIQAMNTGHPGSLTTVHANSTRDVLLRLETMVLLSGFKDVSVEVIREWITSAIDIVIFQKVLPDGKRIVSEILEIKGINNYNIIYKYD